MTIVDHVTAGTERHAREEVRQKLLGAWQLVSYTATGADGTVIHPFGPSPYGLILYTPHGYMSAELGCGDHAFMGSDRAEELARAAVGYVSYAGLFEVIDPATVEHRVTTSLFPNWIGRSQVRAVTFEGKLLKLGIATPVRLWGVDRTAELTWCKPA